MRKTLLLVILAGAVLAACTPGAAPIVEESRFVTIYKLPT